MQKFLVFFLTGFCQLSLGQRTETYKASYKGIRDDKYETTNSLGDYIVRNKYECLTKCGLHSQCLTFFYHETEKRCILHSILFSTTIPSKSGAEWKLFTIANESRRCPSQDGLIYHKEQDFCFRILSNTVQMNYDGKVKPQCTNKGLQLVRIDSAAKNQIVLDVIGNIPSGDHVCIQGTNALTGSLSTWTFDDKSLMPFFNWDIYFRTRQPENKAAEPCLAIIGNSGLWHDFSCNIGRNCYVVCENIS